MAADGKDDGAEEDKDTDVDASVLVLFRAVIFAVRGHLGFLSNILEILAGCVAGACQRRCGFPGFIANSARTCE